MLSVIIPCYNAEDTIKRCLDSILAQTYTNFEIVVIDDGSQDSTAEILHEYSQQDIRVKAYHFQNAGVSIARQRGISLANGEYVIFVDSDDSIQEKLLENISNVISTYNSPEIIRYQSNLFNDASYKDHQRYNFYDSEKSSLSGMSALKAWSIPGKKYAVYWLFAFKRRIFHDIFAFPNLRCYEDIALIPLLIAKSPKVVTIDYIGYNYTCNNPKSLTNSSNKKSERERAIDFVTAYQYAVTNFQKLEEVSPMDLLFFIEDFNRRMQEKFNSLSDDLKEELAEKFGL